MMGYFFSIISAYTALFEDSEWLKINIKLKHRKSIFWEIRLNVSGDTKLEKNRFCKDTRTRLVFVVVEDCLYNLMNQIAPRCCTGLFPPSVFPIIFKRWPYAYYKQLGFAIYNRVHFAETIASERALMRPKRRELGWGGIFCPSGISLPCRIYK